MIIQFAINKYRNIIYCKNAPVFVYDSFGNSDNLNALQLTLNHMFEKLDDFVVHQVVTFYKQVSVNDCGLFALAYVWALCLNFEPSLINFCQDTMRHEYNKFVCNDCKGFSMNIIANLTSTHESILNQFKIRLNLLKN